MRRLLLVLVLAAVALPVATAHATSACAPETGDWCYGAGVRGGVVQLSFSTFSFRGLVRTCVTTPKGERTCRRFRLAETDDGIFAFRKRWSRFFPNGGHGRYRVTYTPAGGDGPLGPGVSFKR